MDPEQRQEEIFSEAIKFKDRAERDAYVAGACGDDRELLARVQSLLHHHDTKAFLDSPAVGSGVTLDDSPLSEGPGTKIGRYKLLQQIGEGGFGVVYMAEQERPVRRRVALKIIKLGMDTKQVIARFEAERQALAIMEHPNIARVFDAGTTDTGRPYFVMELVKGILITDYCDKNSLETQQRLELFIDICRAVQHAHQKGIIHRDIKPSNVMITLHDGKPVPKIIDFGIAKATQHRLTEKTLFTEYRQLIGTPEYMSPEQAEMSGLDVDTRTDIYSLGVLLYELLTGTTPFDAEKLRSAAYDEMLKTIRETDPPKPSTRLNTLGDSLADVAKHRHVEPGQLCKIVRGELDWIVMKTLEKDRSRRYETVNELAMDIERHLSDEPVVANPPSTVYRLRKFARRHRTGVMFGLLVAATLIVGLSLATVGFVQASREQTRTEAALQRAEANFQKARDAVDRMMTNAEELKDVPHMERIQRALLEDALEFYEDFLQERSSDPDVRHEGARSYHRVGYIRRSLGDRDKAEAAYNEAIALLAELVADFPARPEYRRDLGTSYHGLGVLGEHHGDLPKADTAYHDAVALFAEMTAEWPDVCEYRARLASSHHRLGKVLMELSQRHNKKRHNEAEKHFRQAVALFDQLMTQFPTVPDYQYGLGYSRESLGWALSYTEDPQQAEEAYRAGIELLGTLVAQFPSVPEYRRDLANAYHGLGQILLAEGPKLAERAYRQEVSLRKQLVDDFPGILEYRTELADVHNALGGLLSRVGRAEESEKEFRDSLAVWEKLEAGFPNIPEYRERELAQLVGAHQGLAGKLTERGQFDEAEKEYRQALDAQQKVVADYPNISNYRRNLATCYQYLGQTLCKAGRNEEAETFSRESLTIYEELVADFPLVREYRKSLADSYRSLGDVLEKMGRLEEAADAYKRAEEIEKEVEAETTDD